MSVILSSTEKNCFRIISSAAVRTHDKAHILKHLSKDLEFKDVTDELICLGIFGPKSRDLLSKITQYDLSNENVKFSTSKNIIFCWLPGHVGIQGNEVADGAAKASLNMQPADAKVPYTDSKPLINKYVHDKWQSQWNLQIENKLHEIKPIISSESVQSFRSVRREEVVLARCRIGHSHITHSCLLKSEEYPECVFCQEPYTIKHVLIDCGDLALIRQRYYKVNTINELFNTVCYDTIILFLKEINLYNKL
mgnify:CR=1 FL=1